MYARGMSNQNIYEEMQELYGVKVSPDMITAITDKIIPEIREWQKIQLEEQYAIVFVDATYFNVKQDGIVVKKAVYIALGVTMTGERKECEDELKLSLNQKTQIEIVKNGIDFLGYRHILNEDGSITRKLRVSSKQRLKKHLKTLHKLREKNIVDDEYVYIRKNAFYNHIKDTTESQKLKNETFPQKL